MTVLEELTRRRIVPVLILDRLADALPVGAALERGGLPVAEVTLRSPAALDAIRLLSGRGDLLVGAGTVISPDQVDAALEAGARFVVTPGLSERVVARCLALGVPVVPGVATATEIVAALDLGITLLKFFPAEAAGGSAALKALSAPFPQVKFVPTGGLTTVNAPEYLALPSVAALGGSWMVAPQLLAAGDFEAVARLAAEAVSLAGPVLVSL